MSEPFVVNVRDARWARREGFGAGTTFEDREDRFEQIGVNIRVLEPGDIMSKYHRENVQEDFLVLTGECALVLEGEERRLRAWDFVHCPPDTAHVFVGAGEGPCVVLAVGGRGEGVTYHYPVDEAAQRLGAGVEQETDAPSDAYNDAAPVVEDRPPSWNELPWA
jgi:uncharacterized cupin superfamily protein